MSRRKRPLSAMQQAELVEALQCVGDVLFELTGVFELHASAGEQRLLTTAYSAAYKLKHSIAAAPVKEPDDSPPTVEPDERQRRLLEVLQEMDADRMYHC